MIQQLLITIIIIFVGLLSLNLFIIGILSYKRTKDIRLLSISLAFGVFFLKNLITAISLQTGYIPHGDLELVGALFDLLAMMLLLLPIFKKNAKVIRAEVE